MQGTFYEVGVGPGDPQWMTLKAVSTVRACDIVAFAVSDERCLEPAYEPAGGELLYPAYVDNCVAFRIAEPVVEGLRNKAKLYLPMPMIKDRERLIAVHDACAALAETWLAAGKDIAFITLGDPTIYSTSAYVRKRVQKHGYPVEIIPGIPSFCAASARLQTALVENKDQLHVIPASYGVEESLELPGTKVLMKTGRKMPLVKEAVRRKGTEVCMVENCGMPTEQVYHDVEDIPDQPSYYSLLILKD